MNSRHRSTVLAGLFICLAFAATGLTATRAGGQSISRNFVRVSSGESLTVPFTARSVSTAGSYGGAVEVIVSGVGQSYGALANDAFYGVPSGVPVDYPGFGSLFDTRYYQLNLGWQNGFQLVGCDGEPNNLNNFITFVDGVGEVIPPAMPAYDPADDTYDFVVTIPPNAGQLSFGVSDCVLSDNTGAYHIQVFQLASGSTPGTTRMPTRVPTRMPTAVPTATATTVSDVVVVGSALGRPNQTVRVPVSLNAATEPVAAVQADIAFDLQTPIAARSDGQPDCEVNASIDKPESGFTFQPPGCMPGVNCTGVGAVIIAFDNTQPIADGAMLFSCAVEIAGTAEPRTHPLMCSGTQGSDPAAHAVALGCVDGAVVVPPAEAVVVGSAAGRPSESVVIPVSLNAAEQPIAGVQLDVTFDPHTSIAARSDGHPDCAVNPNIDKSASTFSFKPPTCTRGVNCAGVRALIFAIDNTQPIVDGSALFSCTVDIARTAERVTYPLGCENLEGSDPVGHAVPLACVAGWVVVAAACPGDCDGDGHVTVDELLTGVNTLLGARPLNECPAFDTNFDGQLTIDELLKGVLVALNGCPAT